MEHELSQRNAYLQQFWERASKKATGSTKPVNLYDWDEQVRYISQCGIGTEEALHYLYTTKPTFEDFLQWLQTAYQPGDPQPYEQEGPVLTAEDHASWDENGYLVIKDAVPAARCEAARAAIWEFLDADPQIPDTWYQFHDGKKGLMLNFFQHPALASNRYAAKISKAFHELYKDTDIYLLVDKTSFNPPETQSYRFIGSPLHWDVSLQLPIPFKLQGLLYLNDVSAEDGAFHCVPGFHRQIDKWLAELPEGTDPRQAVVTDLKAVPIPGKAGDLVIWHQALPHCATPNKGTSPRMVQYIAYKPVGVADNSTWK